MSEPLDAEEIDVYRNVIETKLGFFGESHDAFGTRALLEDAQRLLATLDASEARCAEKDETIKELTEQACVNCGHQEWGPGSLHCDRCAEKDREIEELTQRIEELLVERLGWDEPLDAAQQHVERLEGALREIDYDSLVALVDHESVQNHCEAAAQALREEIEDDDA